MQEAGTEKGQGDVTYFPGGPDHDHIQQMASQSAAADARAKRDHEIRERAKRAEWLQQRAEAPETQRKLWSAISEVPQDPHGPRRDRTAEKLMAQYWSPAPRDTTTRLRELAKGNYVAPVAQSPAERYARLMGVA
jgi:hypothetical protein